MPLRHRFVKASVYTFKRRYVNVCYDVLYSNSNTVTVPKRTITNPNSLKTMSEIAYKAEDKATEFIHTAICVVESWKYAIFKGAANNATPNVFVHM